MRLNYSTASLSRSHRGQLYQADLLLPPRPPKKKPELRRVENAVPLAAPTGGQEQGQCLSGSASQAQGPNLACSGGRLQGDRGLMKYIYDGLQTCIVPRCCVLSGQRLRGARPYRAEDGARARARNALVFSLQNGVRGGGGDPHRTCSLFQLCSGDECSGTKAFTPLLFY